MVKLRVIFLAAAVAMVPGLAAAEGNESRFSVNRSGGVDATGANTDGSVSGYSSRTFDELASLTAPTVDFTPIENRINNLENTVNNNVTTMADLSNRVNQAQSSADNAQSTANSAYSLANSAYSRAGSAYSRANSAYSKASSAQSTASSAYTQATTHNFTTSSTTYGGECQSYHYVVTKHYLNGKYAFSTRSNKSTGCNYGGI